MPQRAELAGLDQAGGARRKSLQHRELKEPVQTRNSRRQGVVGHDPRGEQDTGNQNIDGTQLVGEQRRDHEFSAVAVVPAGPGSQPAHRSMPQASRRPQPRHEHRNGERVGEIVRRQLQPRDRRQQDDAHHVGSDLPERDRFGNSGASFERSGRDDEQRAEDREGRELMKPDREPGFSESVRDRAGGEEARERDHRREGGAQHRRIAMQPDFRGSVVRPARYMKEENERAADAQCGRREPVKAEGGHQVAEIVLGQDTAQDDQHDELRGEPEHAGAGSHRENRQIGAKAATLARRLQTTCQ